MLNRKHIWLWLTLTLATITGFTQITQIPDVNFEQALIDLGIDKDGVINGSVATADIAGLTSLEIAGRGIEVLTGIQGFVSLEVLDCHNNLLQSMNLNENKALTFLDCSDNKLTSLTPAQLSELTYLDCSRNLIAEINLSGNKNLKEFYCQENKLTNINFKDNLELIALNCADNQFEVLNITFNWKIEQLDFSSNLLTYIDLSNNVRVESLNCNNNPLTSVFLNNTTQLKRIEMVNNDQLTQVNFSHNYQMEEIICRDNDALTSIDIYGLSALTYLNCSNNQLQSLDLSTNTFIENLYCQNNQLKVLDLSKNVHLAFLKAQDNELESLDLKNENNALMTGGITNYDGNMIYVEGMNTLNNPLLLCIQVDNEDAARSGLSPYDSWLKDQTTSYAADCQAFLGIEEELLKSAIKLFPNPARNTVTIDGNEHLVKRVVIYAVSGKMIKRVESDFENIDLSGLAPGVYIFHITLEQGELYKRCIKG